MPNNPPPESASAFIDMKIAALKDWRGPTCAKIRKLIHAADPSFIEQVK